MINRELLMSLEIPIREHRYDDRDVMLYALGTGFGEDPLDERELRFVYERGLQVVPTFATVAAWDRDWVARSGLDWLRVVHGDQRLVLHRALPTSAALVARARVVDVLDKGKETGAVVQVETRVFAAGDMMTPLWTATSGFFARADGGFSAERMKGPAFHTIPARAPDCCRLARTRPDQGLLYRLSGDRNPLHASPSIAGKAGFPRPILHGLCLYGLACRAVLHAFCELEPARIAEFDARFSAPVFPGETLRIEMWKDDSTVSFRARCVERDQIVLDNGRAALRA